jgi:crotonobetainyl-CoA:carnitine CoA-transferase CaiB-like acyl-CoA transferase
MTGTGGPLHGITVIDLGQIYNAPYATLLMALAGARVIKVEPRGGENLRGRGRAGASAPFAMLNSNKQAVTLNLKHPEGRGLLEQLAARADVLVENFRPGVMAGLGLSPDHLRAASPRLVYAAGSGFGSAGPYRNYPAMDLTIQAMSGAMAVTGFPDREPVKAGPAIGDFAGGIHLYGAIITALFERERTGRGCYVEVAMLDAIYPSLMSSLGLFFSGTGEAPGRTANRHSGLAESPYNVFPASDGYLALICVTDAHWTALLGAMGRPDLAARADLATRAGRVEHMDEVDEIVRAWTSGRGKEELAGLLRAARVPCAPVREISEVVTDPHLLERGMLEQIDHPQYGPLTVPHSPLHVGDYRADLEPSPALGQDNAAVYGGWLGLSEAQLADLAEREVI